MLSLKNPRCMSAQDAVDDKKWDSAQEGIERREMQKIVVIRRCDELNRGIDVLPEGQIPSKEPKGR